MPRNPHAATPKLTDAEYAALLERQDGVCAICFHPPKTRRLHIDHDHRTGRIRGLLCYRCNKNLPTYATAEWLACAWRYVEAATVAYAAEVAEALAAAPVGAYGTEDE